MATTHVLIIGGAGFIGSNLAKAWYERGAKVRVLDNLRSGKKENLDDFPCEFIEGSILDLPILQQASENVDYIHHLAAMVSVPESMASPEECEKINVMGTLNVLRCAREAGARKVVFSSSCSVYGNVERDGHRESDTPVPASPYAISKLTGEYYMNLWLDAFQLQTASLRYFNVYGPKQDPASDYAAAIPIFFKRAMKGDTIRIYDDGEQTRDFVFVEDVVQANILAAEKLTGLYNVSRDQSTTVNELAEKIKRITNSSSEIAHFPARPGDLRHSRGISEVIKDKGWNPSTSIDEGLEKTYEYLRAKLA